VRPILAGGLLCGSLAAAAENAAPAKPARGPVTLTDEALQLHRSCLLIDGHNDMPWMIRKLAGGSFEKMDIATSQPALQTDIPRLRKGGLGAQFWAAYVPTHPPDGRDPAAWALDQIDLIHQLAVRYPDTFEMAYTADDIEHIHAKDKIASLIGIEGGHVIDDSLGTLRMFYKLGARYMTLSTGDNSSWCDSATDARKHGGLTPFGEDVVREMNRLGMMVDVAHVSADAMRDALRVSSAPIIASHSGANAVAQHTRNVPDDVLKAIGQRGGIVMVNFYSGYVTPEGAKQMERMFAVSRELHARYPKEADYRKAKDAWHEQHPVPHGDVYSLVDHIDHIVKVAGIDCVGLGSDYDGVESLPEQLDDVSRYPYITQALLNRGYRAEDIRKILGSNLLRVMRAVEAAKEEK
jgi:membrane dipeptidase